MKILRVYTGRFDFDCSRIHFYRLRVVRGFGLCWRGHQIEFYA